MKKQRVLDALKILYYTLAARYSVIEWIFFQMAGVGLMFGQLNHFLKFAPHEVPYAIDRFTTQVRLNSDGQYEAYNLDDPALVQERRMLVGLDPL